MRSYLDILLVTAGVQLMYAQVHSINFAQQLQTVSGELSELAAEVHCDRDMQGDIYKLAGVCQRFATAFKLMPESDGSKILKIRQYIITLQKEIQRIIGSCNGKRRDHDTNRLTSEQECENLSLEISRLDIHIQSINRSIHDLELSARNLDTEAEDLRIQATNDPLYVLALAFVAVLAVFEGGSLNMCLVAVGILHDANLNDVQACNRDARLSRDAAVAKRQKAQTQRSKRDTLVAERRALESEIRTLQTSSDELQQTADGLNDVSRVINDIQQAVSNVDTAMADAEFSSFQLLQNWVASRIPKEFRSCLDTLKKKWACLEKILVQHKASVTQINS